MRSDKQIQASKTNGALSRGPVTAQGKRNSARNGTRHGLLAQIVVLEEESADYFQDLLAAFMDEYRPRTASEISLVETMAVTRWRQVRVWQAQKTALDFDAAHRDRSVGPKSVRALLALLGSRQSSCPHEVLLRYELAFDRQFSRALTGLRALQSLPAAPVRQTSTRQTWKNEKNLQQDDPSNGLKTNA